MAVRYRITEEIGRGAMGRVYLAHDDLLDRDVALKELAVPDYLSDEEKEEVNERFRLEAKAAARLTHPHILTVHDIIASEDRQYIVMEYLEGKTLRDILAERTFSTEEIMSIAPMIGEALYYAHSHGIIHRDVKPDNIFVLESGNIKVADFVIAKMLKVSDRTHTDVIMGTPNYIAPELVKGLSYDHRVDIFSLGVTIYEMLAGRRPFDAENDYAIIYKVASEEPVPLDEFRGDLPGKLVQAVHRALAKEPALRYPSMKELKDDLMLVRADLGMMTAEEEEAFDKEKALQSELEAAKGMAVIPLEQEEAGRYDFSRDKEWKELIARIYHGDKGPQGEESPVRAGSARRRAGWNDLEAELAGGGADHGYPATREAAMAGATVRLQRMPVAPSLQATSPDRFPHILDPPRAVQWSAVLAGAGIVLIAAAMFPWIGKGLNPSRALMGITFPEGIAITIFTVSIWVANALIFLDLGNPRTWIRIMKTLCIINILLVLFFFFLRAVGGVGFEKAAGLGFAQVLKGVGWGLWLALVASLFASWACGRLDKLVA